MANAELVRRFLFCDRGLANKKQRTMAFATFLILTAVVAVNLQEICGHGMVMDPVNRGSAWRLGFDTLPNYTDNQNFCGGVGVQYNINKGKCGECGDDFRDSRPRANENGGTYGTGVIVKTYKKGEQIDVTVRLTASHLGYFEFALCPLRSKTDLETDECFAEYPLDQPDGSSRFYLHDFGNRDYIVPLVLPADLSCEQCVLRWHYRTANSWGICANGTSGLGCGDQEVFRSCSDIAIV